MVERLCWVSWSSSYDATSRQTVLLLYYTVLISNNTSNRFFFLLNDILQYKAKEIQISFSDYHVPLPFPLCMERTFYVFLQDGVFLPCDHGLDFWHQLIEFSHKLMSKIQPVVTR